MKLAPCWSQLALCAIGTVLLSTAGCAGSSYMGISLAPVQTTSELQELAQRAQNGDKQAQLDLGIRFEEGNGVPRDKARAMKLYRQAASDSGGTMWVYMPSTGNGAKGRVVPLGGQPNITGLVEAQLRLQRILLAQ
ncbi:SEL1-like repeat protein [Sphingobium sp. LMA1-1-1.1]|uniref:hypothetical protein n=1 Tax=Sphingobium sp. LMA1-1-1.1 TaxID=3135238 RepID=UPI00343EAD42